MTRWYAVVMDVTATREAEDERRRLGEAIEQVRDSIVVLDRVGRITYVNPAFEQSTGYSRAEAVGQTLKLLRSGTHTPEFYAGLSAAIANGEFWMADVTNRRKDGSLLTEQTVVSPIRDENGVVTSFVSVKHDITTQRELENRLRQTERLEAVGQLAGGIAHDFNNLIAAIRSHGELLQVTLPAGSEARSDIDEVLRTADRAAALTRQLLTFSRRRPLEPQVVDPRSVIDGLLPMLRRLLGGHIEVVTAHSRDLGRVTVDPGQLEQVIVNLAVNARDAMPDGGRLTITTANHSDGPTDAESGTEPNRWVRMTVSDSGTGMDEATLAHIWDPFFTTKGPKGTGLGLPTCHGIISASGGRMSVASTRGSGTSFTIDLPYVDAAPEAAPGPVAARPRAVVGVGETVLLVDDEDAVRRGLARVLTGLGFTVLAAGSGAEALEIAGSHQGALDLLVTDVQMPGMQGPDLVRRIRAIRPGVKALMISGYPGMAGLEKTRELGGVRVLEKPFTREAPADAARSTLDAA